MIDREQERNRRAIEQLENRLATGTVKPEWRDEDERFEVMCRAANQESRGGTWE